MLKRNVSMLLVCCIALFLTGCSNKGEFSNNTICADNQINALESFKIKRSADIVNYEKTISKVKILEYLYSTKNQGCEYFILETFPYKNTYSINYYIYNYTNGLVNIKLKDCIYYKNIDKKLYNSCSKERDSNLLKIRNMGFKYSDDYGLNGYGKF